MFSGYHRELSEIIKKKKKKGKRKSKILIKDFRFKPLNFKIVAHT